MRGNMRGANNQNEGAMMDKLFIFLAEIFLVSITVVILVFISLALYANNISTSLASSLIVTVIIIFFALVLYLDRKAIMYEGGDKGK